jgi:hypothetical protein
VPSASAALAATWKTTAAAVDGAVQTSDQRAVSGAASAVPF